MGAAAAAAGRVACSPDTGFANIGGRKYTRDELHGEGVISLQVAQEFCSAALRGKPRPLRPEDVARILTEIAPLLRVEPSLQLLQAGLSVYQRHRTSWYDALIVAAAQLAGCTVLYSEDLQHGQQFERLCVENPFLV